jgi:hypothetical protein
MASLGGRGRTWKDVVVTCFKVLTNVVQTGLEEITQNLRHAATETNRGLPDHETESYLTVCVFSCDTLELKLPCLIRVIRREGHF